MKTNLKNNIIVLLFSALIMLPVKAQELKKIIDKGNVEQLEKYITKTGNLNEIIEVKYEDKTYKVNGLIYLLGNQEINENQKKIFDAFLKNIDLFDNKEQVISEAFVYSFSVEGDEYYIEKLWDLKPNLTSKCSICNGNTALIAAAIYGNQNWYFKLKPLSTITDVNETGYTILHAAIFGENIEILEDVLATKEVSAMIDKPNPLGYTPLDMSIGCYDKRIYDLILNSGANPDKAKDLLWEAVSYFNLKIFDLEYAIKGTDKFYDELWKSEEGFYTIVDGITMWVDEIIEGIEFSTLLIQERDFSQAKMLKYCLDYMVQSTMSDTYKLNLSDELLNQKENINDNIIYFISKYYTTVDEFLLDDSAERKEAIQLLNEIVCELKNLDTALNKKNITWITKKNKKNATKYLSGILEQCSL